MIKVGDKVRRNGRYPERAKIRKGTIRTVTKILPDGAFRLSGMGNAAYRLDTSNSIYDKISTEFNIKHLIKEIL